MKDNGAENLEVKVFVYVKKKLIYKQLHFLLKNGVGWFYLFIYYCFIIIIIK